MHTNLIVPALLQFAIQQAPSLIPLAWFQLGLWGPVCGFWREISDIATEVSFPPINALQGEKKPCSDSTFLPLFPFFLPLFIFCCVDGSGEERRTIFQNLHAHSGKPSSWCSSIAPFSDERNEPVESNSGRRKSAFEVLQVILNHANNGGGGGGGN